MSKFWVIFKREYLQVVKKKSFVVGIILTPVLMAAFTMLPALLATKKASDPERMAVIDQSGEGIGALFVEKLETYELEDGRPYYDVRGIIEVEPGDNESLAGVRDSLSQAILDQSIKYYLVVKPDAHLVDTNIYLVSNADNFRSFSRFEYQLSRILSSRRLETSDVNLPVDSVLELTRRLDLPVQNAKGESISFLVKYISALAFVGIMMAMILGYGQLVMRSVIEEKQSRIMEVLVSSVSPFQLMLGKVLGLGAATLTQVAVWVLLGLGMYSMKGMIDMDPSINKIVFNPAIVTFFVLYLVIGYVFFSTLFALIGSIVTDEKEAQNFVAPITISLIMPFLIAMYIVQEPNSVLSVVLSFIPLLTPTLMLMRVVFVAPTLTDYSLFSGIIGEAALGVVVVLAATLGMIWLTGKIFRVGILMYGKRPTLPEIWRWVRH